MLVYQLHGTPLDMTAASNADWVGGLVFRYSPATDFDRSKCLHRGYSISNPSRRIASLH